MTFFARLMICVIICTIISMKAINNKADATRRLGEERKPRCAHVSLVCSYLTCCRSAFTPETRSPEVVVGDLFYSVTYTVASIKGSQTHFTSGHRDRTYHKIWKKNIQKKCCQFHTDIFCPNFIFIFLWHTE